MPPPIVLLKATLREPLDGGADAVDAADGTGYQTLGAAKGDGQASDKLGDGDPTKALEQRFTVAGLGCSSALVNCSDVMLLVWLLLR